jgi:hypothetical protein
MKKSIYISGIVSAVLMTIGATFKIQHWPGAGIILMVSIFFFVTFFVPATLWNNYQHTRQHAYLYISIFLTLLICFATALFKIQHWPGAGILVLVGVIAPFLIFLPAYIVYYNKQTNKDITNLIAVLFLLVFVAVMDALLVISLR